jgi:filamentous hemagglutinin family protein
MTQAYAGPSGGVGSDVTITSTTSTVTDVIQNSNKAIINWSDYNLDSNESVNYSYTGGGDFSVLNRIADGTASLINGSISAPGGEVFLINANGIIFGASASINVGSLIASSLDISDSNFMNGTYVLDTTGATRGRIENKGTIEAASGGAALIGHTVSNSGTVTAALNTVGLIAGNKVTIDFQGDGLMTFSINTSLDENGGFDDAVAHSGGTLSAKKVLLTAQAAAGVFTNIINVDGIIRASNINETEGGEIVLNGTAAGSTLRLSESAELDATGTQSSGSVQMVSQAVNGDASSFISEATIKTGEFDTTTLQSSVDLGVNSNITADTSATISAVSGEITNRGVIESPFVLLDSSGDINQFGDIISDNYFPTSGGTIVLVDPNPPVEDEEPTPPIAGPTSPVAGPTPPIAGPTPPIAIVPDSVVPDPVVPDPVVETVAPAPIVVVDSRPEPNTPDNLNDLGPTLNAASHITVDLDSLDGQTLTSALNLFAVEGAGIRLPADQDSEGEL